MRKMNKTFIKQAKKSFLNKTLYKPLLYGNSKPFYSYLKKCRSNESSSIPKLKYDKKIASTSEEKANCLNNYFESVFTEDDQKGVTPTPVNIPDIDIRDIAIDYNGVLKLLNDIDIRKSCGPDNISGIMLKTFSIVIYKTLGNLFSYSLKSSTLPTIWKLARIQPVHKKGSKQLPTNYRPISLTCITCKLLEHIVSSHMHSFLKTTDFLTDNQHGFRPHRSCETQLAHTIGHISHLFDLGKSLDIIILDFSKAFDSVNHRKLVSKLRSTGICKQVVLWVKGFLLNRQQYVEVDGHKSLMKPAISGVPQGSVLGPLLFLVYINDLPSFLSSECRLFADDALLYNTADHTDLLQQDLCALELWADCWQMSFNVAKCCYMRVGKTLSPHPGYVFGRQALKKVMSHAYLGVELQGNLKWDLHINTITSKATQRLALLRRVLKTADMPTRKIAYYSIVRSTLEFASQVWDPYEKNKIKQLEKIQNQALRFIFNIRGHVSFSELREKTDIPSLKERRKSARFSLFHKCIAEGIEPSFNYDLEKKYNTRQKSNRYTPYIRTNIFYNSFWPRTLRELRS